MEKKTKEKLESALLDLVSKEKIEDIDVVQLCRTARVSRGTFYTYYSSVIEVAADIKKEIESSFGFINENNLDVSHYIAKALSLAKEKPAVFKIILRSISESNLSIFRFLHLEEKIHLKYSEYYANKDEAKKEMMKLKMTGMISLAKTWLDNGCILPVETVTAIIVSLMKMEPY